MPIKIYSPEEVLLKMQSAGRIVPALDYILDILQVILPPTIEHVNQTRRGKNGELLALPRPTGYYTLGEVVEDFPAVIIGAETDTQATSPQEFADTSNIMVFSAYESFTTKQQYYDSQDLAGLIRGILMLYTTGQCTDDGKKVWTQMIPTGITSVSGRWTDYKGHAVHIQIFQAPYNDLWKV